MKAENHRQIKLQSDRAPLNKVMQVFDSGSVMPKQTYRVLLTCDKSKAEPPPKVDVLPQLTCE
jgi:hypothetical protein